MVMSTLVSTDKDAERELLTAEEFLDWLQPKIYADLISGEKHMHSPVNFRHATILNFVQGLLTLYIENRQLGQLHRENIAVRFDSRDVFMPDLCFFTKAQVGRLHPNHAAFAPALVVEALSSSTAARDVGVKFTAYEQHGIREYWVLDPQTMAHRFYALEGDIFVEFGHGDELIRSRVIPGFYLRRAWLDPVEPPPVMPCLREILAAAS